MWTIDWLFSPRPPKILQLSRYWSTQISTKPLLFWKPKPDQEFLGFQLELDPFELCYQPPQDLSQVLSPMSASFLLSGFAFRGSIVHRGSYPKAQVDEGIYMLKRLYLRAGFKEEDLNKIVKRVLKQRK